MFLALDEPLSAKAMYIDLLQWAQPLSERHMMVLRAKLEEVNRQLSRAAGGESSECVGNTQRIRPE